MTNQARYIVSGAFNDSGSDFMYRVEDMELNLVASCWFATREDAQAQADYLNANAV